MSSEYRSPAILALERERERLRNEYTIDSEGNRVSKLTPAVDEMIDGEIKSVKTQESQEWFKLAEGPAMSMTGVSHGGAFPAGYADVSMFNPKAMPGSLSEKEEEERKRLRTLSMVAPGLMDPYLMG